MQRLSRRAIVALAAFLIASPAAASASTGGVRIIVQTWSPSAPTVQKNDVVLDRPGLLSDALNEGWAKARTPVCDALKAEAGKPNRLAPGFSLYDIACNMAPAGTLEVMGLAGNALSLAYRLPGNTFKAHSTQPTAAGSYADPCFMLSYDLSAKTVVHLDTLAVDTFTVAIDRVSRPDSCNTAGDIAKFAATTVHFFGGPDFLKMTQDAIERHQDIGTASLNAAVDSFVKPMRQYAGRYATQTNWVRHGDLYFAFAPMYNPQPLAATLAGTIDMPKAHWFANAPDCATFTVLGTVQTGPAPILNPESLAVGAAPSIDVGAVSASGIATDAGDRFQCAYIERQLPAGVPVTFRASGKSAGDQRGHVRYVPTVRPEGWSGTETIASASSGKNFLATVAPEVVGFGDRVNLGQRYDPVDPAAKAAANAATRVNPAILQGAVANPNERLSRVALNPQPLPPKSPDALVTGGNAAFARGDFAAAAASYERAIATNANDAIALHDLALAHARLGRADTARTELLRAATLARQSGDLGTAGASDRAIIIVSGRH